MRSARISAFLVLLVLLAACSAGGGAAESAAPPEDARAVEDRAASVALGGDDAAVSQADGEAPAAEDATVDSPAVEELPDGPALPPGERMIKEGTISVEVAEGRFDQSLGGVIEAAQRLGGDAVASSTRTAENGDTFGSVTVRVPVDNFEELLLGLGDVGTVRHRDVGSTDVSAEFTDLESRLRHLQAQERFYLGLFEKADTVQDAIAVQQQLDGIQSQIEKAQGRLNFLDDRTSFSTLTVELFEPGAGGPLVEEEEPTDRPSLARYWDTARDAFVNVVGAMLVVVLFLLPLLVPLSVVGALWLARRRSRRTDAPLTADPAEERESVSADA